MDISCVPKKIHRHTLRAINFLSSGPNDYVPEANIIERVKFLTKHLKPVEDIDQAVKRSLCGYCFLDVLDYKECCYSRLYELDTSTIARRVDDIISLSRSLTQSDSESEESAEQLGAPREMEHPHNILQCSECGAVACFPNSDGDDNSQAENSSEPQEFVYEENPEDSTLVGESSGSEYAIFDDLL